MNLAIIEELEEQLAHATSPESFFSGLPVEVHGGMIYDASGDALVSRLPSGEPYFDPETSTLIKSALNHLPELLHESKENLEKKEELSTLLLNCEDILKTLLTQQGGLTNETNNQVYNLSGVLEQIQSIQKKLKA